MADVVYLCADCGKQISVSEYADAFKLKCPGCGGTDLAKAPGKSADGEETGDGKLRLRVRTVEPIGQAGEKGPREFGEPSQADIMKDSFGPNRKVVGKTYKGGVRNVLGAWGLFFAIGGATYILRFREIGMPADILELIKTYAWVPILLMWIITVLTAIKDNIFVGILCMLVPGFFLYYLLMQERFYLRAVTFGLLVGFGYDTVLLVQEGWETFYRVASDWIARGG